MTRDEVLEAAAQVCDAEVEKWFSTDAKRAARDLAMSIRALKSKPPESSPTLDAPPQREVTTDIDRLVDERDELRRRLEAKEASYAALLAQRDSEYVQATGLRGERDALQRKLENERAVRQAEEREKFAAMHRENEAVAERDALKAQLESQERRAEHWETQAGQHKRDVERLEWEARGAPMPGEEPQHSGHPTDCAACDLGKVP